MDNFFEILQMPVVWRALAVGVPVTLCASLLGVVLVLKHYALIGHGLSDVGFAALSLSAALGLPPLAVAFPSVLAASTGIMAYSQKKGVAGDAAIGVASTAALAFGVIVTALTKGFNADVYGYMFGSIVALGRSDVVMGILLSLAVLAVFTLFYNRLLLITADETFANALGLNVTLYQFLIALLTALTVVVGMRLMGSLLISSLIIFPVMTAKKVAKGFGELALWSAGSGVLCFLLGLIASILWNIPTGAGIVAANATLLLLSRLFARKRKG